MRLSLCAIILAAALVGCAAPAPKPAAAAATPTATPTPGPNPPHIPDVLLPNGGSTGARKAGFGAGGAFVR